MSNHRWLGMLSAMGLSFVLSLPCTGLIVYLSNKLDDIYFAVGTLTIYFLANQLSTNLYSVTNGSFGLSVWRELRGMQWLYTNTWFLLFVLVLVLMFVLCIHYCKNTYGYKVLMGRGERDHVIVSLGVQTTWYKVAMISLTTLMAVVGGWLYSFYVWFIDPSSFWIWFLMLVVTVSFLSYSSSEWMSLMIAIVMMCGYEWLRFFKIVELSKLWYFREMIFALIIMGASYRVFKKEKFGRAH